jgi:Na+-translocating ferredoxin:NAD+ oxidoreductase subunit B
MDADVYERLARHLDNLPGGYPRTESGVELSILRRLFTPEEAELALHLTLIPEDARVVALRARVPVEEAAGRLEGMAQKGLIIPVYIPHKTPRYMAQQWVIGFWETQVDRLTPELVHDFEEYFETFGRPERWRKAPQLRTIPVRQNIDVAGEILSYERAEELVRRQTKFAVANCICRQEMALLGHPCSKPLETCMTFGMAAGMYVSTGRGRAIDMQEALRILALAEETGLVLQPSNARDAVNICACCGCCCGVLRMLKLSPEPASVAVSPYRAELSAELCDGCGTCEQRCQMAAIAVDGGGKAELDPRRCIGCGLCVSTCPSGALSLVRKPEAEQPRIPAGIRDAYIEWGQARGKMSYPSLAAMQVMSAVDRFRAR